MKGIWVHVLHVENQSQQEIIGTIYVIIFFYSNHDIYIYIYFVFNLVGLRRSAILRYDGLFFVLVLFGCHIYMSNS